MLLAEFMNWLTTLDGGVIKLGLILLAGVLVIGAWIIAATWERARQSEQRTRLVQTMVQRGMSAEQIARVLFAGQLAAEAEDAEKQDESDGQAVYEDESAGREVRLVKALTSWSYDSEDVQRILAAARVDGKIDAATFDIARTLAESWAETDSIVSVLESRRARGPRLMEQKSA
ncbi:MAG: hypothetical protein JNG88_05595 [Phycisphaerales bacterium]|nr:hypothetical protein [Phycisphaerales bacterium]